MAYNPFDDVIEQDPAYMQTGGQSVIPQRRADYTQETSSPFVDAVTKGLQLITPKDQTLEQIEKNKQLRSLSTAQALKGTKFEEYAGQADLPSFVVQSPGIKERLDAAGYERQSAFEGASRIMDFMAGDEKRAFEKLSAGQKLDQSDIAAVAMTPLIALDAIGLGALATRLGRLGFKKIDDVLKSTSQDPDVIKVKETLGGGDIMQKIQSTIMRSPADEGAGGSGLTGKQVGLALGPDAKKEKSYGYLRQSFENFKKTKPNIISPNTFYDYLNKQGVKLQVGEGTKRSGITHLRKAINFLDPEANLVSGRYLPWMFAAENIMKASDKTLTSRDILKGLKAQGFDIQQNKIEGWLKSGINIQDKNLLNKVNITKGKYSENIRGEKVDAILSLINQLENDPSLTKKGFKEYSINVPSEQRDINMKNIMAGLNKGTSKSLIEDLGKENVEKLNSLIGAPDEVVESVFDQYMPISPKRINNLYNTGVYKLKQAYRDGTFKNSDNFEDVMASYGIQKKDSPYYVKQENQQRVQQLIDDLEMLDTPAEKAAYQKIYNESKELSDYTIPEYKKTIMSSEALQKRLLEEYRKFDPEADLETALNMTGRAFGGHVSHIYRIDDFAGSKKDFKRGMKGMGTIANMVRVNFGIENLGLQQTAENVLDTNIQAMKRAFKAGDMEKVEKLANVIKQYDEYLTTKGMAAYRRLSKKALTPEVIKKLNEVLGKNVAGTIRKIKDVTIDGEKVTGEGKVSAKYNDILIGSNMPQTLIDQKMRFDNLMAYFLENPKALKIDLRDPLDKSVVIDTMRETPYSRKGFLNLGTKDIIENSGFKRGGPVKMAMGGDPLTNLNQQQFAPDPAFEGEDYFQQAVDSGNLYAFNPTKLFKLFGKVDGVQTPKKITEPEAVDAPAGTTLPATQVVQPQDFPFRSYTLEAIMDPNAPKAATPQAWADFLVKGKKSPISEIQDSGLEQYLRDFESYFPNQKITQTQLIDYYETSPIGNLSFKVKEDTPIRQNQDPAYSQYSGGQKHKEAGNQPLDEIGSEYREIVVEAGPLPGETRPYVQSGHYNEPNVIGFTRVANYTGKDGNPIAVIQEMQTDMLTTVRKEQERLQALLGRIKNYKASAEAKLQSTSEYDISMGQQMLQSLNQKYPPTVIKALEENQNLIKPFPNEAGKELIPGFAQDIQNLQKQIDVAVQADIAQTNPDTGFLLTQINNQQMEVLNKLQDLNRSGEIDQILGGIKIPSASNTDDLTRIANDPDPSYLEDGFSYGTKELTLFPPIPFNKQPDYVDLLLKATIKDAQSKGINKVAIYPADLVNRRWSKTPGSDAAKKFEDLYGKVAIQQMKNIAKKYGGTAQFEAITDPTKASKGLRYYNRNIDGNKFDILKEEVPRAELSPEEVQPFFDEQIKRMIDGQGSDFRVALTREVAPGQTMDYFVLPADNDKGFLLQPFKAGDELEDAQIVIEEFNPQEIKMFTITLDSPKAEQPMYLFKKKSGGSIDKDSLVSITDIYGEYGR